tara:strand:- start:5502 stop:6461 length:960 start_codon:yes stop_codon:yes gene_type:complete
MSSIISTDINKAAELLKNGSVVGIPTETVYGLGASIFNPIAIDYIFELKKRPRTNPLIVHISSVRQLSDLTTEFPKPAQKLADAFWPGSLTMVLPKSDKVPYQITANKPTVAVRIPDHPVFLKLIDLAGPIAAPSANPYERISPTTAIHVASYFPLGLPLVIDGGSCKNGIESTIVGFEEDKVIIYRLGSISVEEIEAVVGKVALKNEANEANITPGMSQKHYAPITKTIVTDFIEDFIEDFKQQKIGVIRFMTEEKNDNVTKHLTLSPEGSLEEAASNIYAYLHELDELKLDFILIEPLPNRGVGRSINDRLKRATHL